MNTLALTSWNNNVSPLFDSATTLAVYKAKEAPITLDLSNKSLLDKIILLNSLGASVLICGAISGFSMSLLLQHKITVVPWIRGPIDEVLAAYKEGTLSSMRCYCLPGCGFRGHGKFHGKGALCRHKSIQPRNNV